MAEEARVVVARRVPRGREGQHALLDDGVAQVLVADLGAAQEAAGEGPALPQGAPALTEPPAATAPLEEETVAVGEAAAAGDAAEAALCTPPQAHRTQSELSEAEEAAMAWRVALEEEAKLKDTTEPDELQ